MHGLFKQLGNGEFVLVASGYELDQTVQLVEVLNGTWPGNYVVRDSEDNDVALTERVPKRSLSPR